MRMLRTAGEERTPVKGLRLQGYKLCVIVLRTAGLERAPEKGLQRTAGECREPQEKSELP